MSKPRRRRFAANRESKYQAQVHDDDGRGVYVPDVPAPTVGEDGFEDDPDSLAARAAEDFTAGESPSLKTLPPAFAPNLIRHRRPLGRRRFTIYRLVFVSGLCLGLGALLGYRLPRRPPSVEGSPRAASPAEAKLLTPADQADLDAAYAARGAGRFKDAEARFLALGQSHPAWKSMLVEIGRTRLYARDSGGSATVLKQAVATGQEPAEANAILGALYMAKKDFPTADSYFDQAVALAPTDPDYYFFRGECLRAQGKVGQATLQFRSALLRNQYETATGLYRLKLWLSEIESDQARADGTNARIDAALVRPDPPMEVLFAAAARDLKAGDSAGAVRRILLARPRTDPGVYQIIINDPVFAPVRTSPELGAPSRPAVVPSSTAAPSNPPLPGAATILEAPHVWPAPSAAAAAPPPTIPAP